MVTEESSDDIHAALINAPGTRAILRTDGKGRVLEARGLDEAEARKLAERIDLAVAATSALGRAQTLGAPTMLVLEFGDGVLFAGVNGTGEHVVVVSDRRASVGLVLSRLRRLIGEGASDRVVAA